jgi:hypothetical protein
MTLFVVLMTLGLISLKVYVTRWWAGGEHATLMEPTIRHKEFLKAQHGPSSRVHALLARLTQLERWIAQLLGCFEYKALALIVQ